MYLAQDKAPMLKAILDRIAPQRDRRKRQVRGSPRTRSYHMSKCYATCWNTDCPVLSDPRRLSERHGGQNPETCEWCELLSSAWSRRLPPTFGEWDWISEDRRDEENVWDSVHVLPRLHQGTTCPGGIFCLLTVWCVDRGRKWHTAPVCIGASMQPAWRH